MVRWSLLGFPSWICCLIWWPPFSIRNKSSFSLGSSVLAQDWALRQSQLTILEAFLFAFQLVSPPPSAPAQLFSSSFWNWQELQIMFGVSGTSCRESLKGTALVFLAPPNSPATYRVKLCFHGGVARQKSHCLFTSKQSSYHKALWEPRSDWVNVFLG